MQNGHGTLAHHGHGHGDSHLPRPEEVSLEQQQQQQQPLNTFSSFNKLYRVNKDCSGLD